MVMASEFRFSRASEVVARDGRLTQRPVPAIGAKKRAVT
jgi:hypothetical protein